MGFLGFLIFLAWPVFALGYPLCASIRAIETGSKRQMKKLVIYWTLFSLMSLFEIAFVKIIEWIPYWSGIKLIVICWLVVPQFDGACYVYDCLVHPCLSLDIQAIISTLYKKKENEQVKTEIFLDVAEKYIKENGSEAFKKLIATKLECMKSDSSPIGRQVENNVEATLKQPQSEQDTIQKDKVMLQPTVQNATKLNVTKLANHTQQNLGMWVEKKSDALADVKEMASSDSKSAESNFPETLPEKVLCEWTCALCSVSAASETIFNAHLQGKKHKSKCKQLDTTQEDKVILQPTEQSATNPNVTNLLKCMKPDNSPSDRQVRNLEEQKAEATLKQLEKEQHTTQEDKAMVQFTEQSATKPSVTKPANHAQPNLGTSVEQKPAPADVEETAPQEAKVITCPETLPVKEVPREWKCALCSVTTTSETIFNAHLQGKKHKSKCKQLDTTQEDKVILQPTEQSATNPNVTNLMKCMKPDDSPTDRQVRNPEEQKAEATLKQLEKEQDTTQEDKAMLQLTEQSATKPNVTKLANHAQPDLGTSVEQKSAPADVEEMAPQEAKVITCPETLPVKKVQREWKCALCSVTTTSEALLNDHLQGKKHRSKCKQLDTSHEDKVMLQPTEQSATKPNVTKLANHAQPNLGTCAEKKSDAPVDTKEIAPPNSKTPDSNRPETPPPKNVQREWTCALCLVTTTCEKNLNDHLQGYKHKYNCEQLKISKNTPKGTGSSPLMKDKSNNAESEAVKKPAGDGLLANALYKAERKGKTQLANNHQMGTIPKLDGSTGQRFKQECDLCGVTSPSHIDWVSHIKGQRHLSNIDKFLAGTSQ